MKLGSHKQIGRTLRALRKERRIRAVELADKLGVTRQHIYAMEAGTKGLTVERIRQLTRILQVDPNELLGNGR